jgi:hypothetical protein
MRDPATLAEFWMPIKTAPRDRTPVLVYVPERMEWTGKRHTTWPAHVVIARWFTKPIKPEKTRENATLRSLRLGGYWSTKGDGTKTMRGDPIAWMPVPAAPAILNQQTPEKAKATMPAKLFRSLIELHSLMSGLWSNSNEAIENFLTTPSDRLGNVTPIRYMLDCGQPAIDEVVEMFRELGAP